MGAWYEWKGNDQVGHGRMTVTEAKAPTTIRVDLNFISPMPGGAKSGWDIVADGDAKSKATWWVEGTNDFMAKAFGLFMDIEGMIGDTYDKGLKKLNAVAKKEAEVRAKAKAEAEAKAKAEAEAKAKAEAEAQALAAAGGEGGAAGGDAKE